MAEGGAGIIIFKEKCRGEPDGPISTFWVLIPHFTAATCLPFGALIKGNILEPLQTKSCCWSWHRFGGIFWWIKIVLPTQHIMTFSKSYKVFKTPVYKHHFPLEGPYSLYMSSSSKRGWCFMRQPNFSEDFGSSPFLRKSVMKLKVRIGPLRFLRLFMTLEVCSVNEGLVLLRSFKVWQLSEV